MNKEIEDLKKIILKLSNIKEINNFESANPEKISQDLKNISELLQFTTKTNFNIFMRKYEQKVREMNENRISYENALMNCEEYFSLERVKAASFYEEKFNFLNLKVKELEKKLQDLSAENIAVKNELKENKYFLNCEIENLKKDSRNKNELLKNKEEIIKNINENKNTLSKELIDLKEKMMRNEEKIKIENSELMGNIQSSFRNDIEKLKNKIKMYENDLSNKKIELEKSTNINHQQKRELRLKIEQIEKFELENNQIIEKNKKIREDLQKMQNKIENLEIIVKNKNNEISNLIKEISDVNKEKNYLNDEMKQKKFIIYKKFFKNKISKFLFFLSEYFYL